MIKVKDVYYKVIPYENRPSVTPPPDDSQPLCDLPRLFDDFFQICQGWDDSILYAYSSTEKWSPVGLTELMTNLGWVSIELPWARAFVSPWGFIYVVWVAGDLGNRVTPFNSWRSYMATCMGATL